MYKKPGKKTKCKDLSKKSGVFMSGTLILCIFATE